MIFHPNVLGPRLVHRDHDVEVVTTAREDGVEQETREGMEFHFLPGTPPDVYSTEFNEKSYKQIQEIDRERDIDILVNESAAGAGYAKNSGTSDTLPMVSVLHNTPLSVVRTAYSKGGLFQALYGGYSHFKFYLTDIRHCYKKSERLICVSEYIKRSASLHPSVDSDKLTVIRNGVNMNEFRPIETTSTNSDEFVVLYLGRVVKEKGVQYAIKANNDLVDDGVDARLLVVGPGEYEQFERQAKDLDIQENVTFVGPVDQSELVEYYNRCDVYVLPSIHKEGLPFTVLEAMSCEKPVVASDIGGVDSAVQHDKTGYLITPRDVEDLKHRLHSLYESPELREQMCAAGRERVRRAHSLESMTEKYIRVFEKILGSSASGTA
jgi:glycosyltransferase involved in cell wall biosynthesis